MVLLLQFRTTPQTLWACRNSRLKAVWQRGVEGVFEEFKKLHCVVRSSVVRELNHFWRLHHDVARDKHDWKPRRSGNFLPQFIRRRGMTPMMRSHSSPMESPVLPGLFFSEVVFLLGGKGLSLLSYNIAGAQEKTVITVVGPLSGARKFAQSLN